MVDAQTIGVVVTAASVTVAAIYYMITLRETLRNRRVTLASTLMQNLISLDGSRRWAQLMTIEVSGADDFEAKFGAGTNPENFAIRNNIWNMFDTIGYQYRSGLIDFDTLWSICNAAPPQCWAKFKPVIDEFRGSGRFSKDHYRDFEYLAVEMAKRIAKADPSYRGNPAYFKPSAWENAFPTSKSP